MERSATTKSTTTTTTIIFGIWEITPTITPITKQHHQKKLNQYQQTNFAQIDTESNQRGGYKFWDIAGKQIYYYKIKSNSGEIIEGVAVTSPQYFEVLMEDGSEWKLKLW